MFNVGEGVSEGGVDSGMELQHVHNSSMLGRKVCCRGLAWCLRWWGGKYLLLIGFKKVGVSCWLGRLFWDFCVDVITLG